MLLMASIYLKLHVKKFGFVLVACATKKEAQVPRWILREYVGQRILMRQYACPREKKSGYERQQRDYVGL